MDALGDLVLCDDHPEAVALRTGGDPTREYDYRRFRGTARKTGNFLRHLGVRDGATVAVADDPAPEAILAFLGTALLGGTALFGPHHEADARVLVAPTTSLDEYDLPPGGQFVGYGTPPDDPSHHYFERDVWSENPGFPETAVDPERSAIETADRPLTHADVLAAAREVATDLDPTDEVAVRAPLADPGTVVAGVVAPLLVGASILLPGGGDVTGTVAVVAGDGDGEVPEARLIDVTETA